MSENAEREAREAIQAARGDVHALLEPVLLRMRDDEMSASAAVEELKSLPYLAGRFAGPKTRSDLRSPKEASDFIARHGLTAFLSLPRRGAK